MPWCMMKKIQNPNDFKNQRRRWLSTNMVYFKKFAKSGLQSLFLRGNIDIVDKLYQMILPPRLLLLGVVLLISLMHWGLALFWIELNWIIAPVLWHALLLITAITFLASIPTSFYNKNTLKACLDIPRAFAIMFLLLFKLKGANSQFIHTKHHSTSGIN